MDNELRFMPSHELYKIFEKRAVYIDSASISLDWSETEDLWESTNTEWSWKDSYLADLLMRFL